MSLLFSTISLLLILTGCGIDPEDSSDDNTTIINNDPKVTLNTLDNSSSDNNDVNTFDVDASEVTINDFIVASATLTKEEFLEKLNSEDSFILYESESAISSAQDECIENTLASSTATFQQDEDNTYYINLKNIDVTSCFKSNENITTYIVSFYTNKLLAKNTNGDFVDLTGKTMSQIDELDTVQKRAISKFKLIVETNGENFTINSYDAIIGSDGFDSVCEFKSPLVCTYRSADNIEFTNPELIPFNTSTIIQMNASVLSEKDTYFNSGHADFQINDWVGTMTYTDSNTTPTFTASDGNESVSGTFSYTE